MGKKKRKALKENGLKMLKEDKRTVSVTADKLREFTDRLKERHDQALKERIAKLNEPLVTIEQQNEVFKFSKEHPVTKNQLSIKLNINHKVGTHRITTLDDIEDFRFRDHHITIVVTELIKVASEFAQKRIKEIKNTQK